MQDKGIMRTREVVSSGELLNVNSTCNVSLMRLPSYMKTNGLDSGPKPRKKGAGVGVKDEGGITEEGGSTDGGITNEGVSRKRGASASWTSPIHTLW